jgi:hypothetical protein
MLLPYIFPFKNISVTEVGGKEAGHGTVELISTCNDQKYVLHLEDVLHVPGQMEQFNFIRRMGHGWRPIPQWEKAN